MAPASTIPPTVAHSEIGAQPVFEDGTNDVMDFTPHKPIDELKSANSNEDIKGETEIAASPVPANPGGYQQQIDELKNAIQQLETELRHVASTTTTPPTNVECDHTKITSFGLQGNGNGPTRSDAPIASWYGSNSGQARGKRSRPKKLDLDELSDEQKVHSQWTHANQGDPTIGNGVGLRTAAVPISHSSKSEQAAPMPATATSTPACHKPSPFQKATNNAQNDTSAVSPPFLPMGFPMDQAAQTFTCTSCVCVRRLGC